jgi:hypothetical protein
MTMPWLFAPSHSEFDEEFFMIPSWADHVTELQ